MASLQDFTDEFDSIDATLAAEGADVAAIEAKIAQLQSQISSGGLTADEETAVKARLDASRAGLEALKAQLDTDATA